MAYDKPTDEQIDAEIEKYRAKNPGEYRLRRDQTRVCYEWLDAQKSTVAIVQSGRALKHMVKAWAACDINWQEVMVAANLHPDFRGTSYPNLNLSKRLVVPKLERIAGIACVGAHGAHGEPGAKVNMIDYDGGREGAPKRDRRRWGWVDGRRVRVGGL